MGSNEADVRCNCQYTGCAKLISDPWDPSSEIQQAYTNAAEAYYQQALLALDANTRTGLNRHMIILQRLIRLFRV